MSFNVAMLEAMQAEGLDLAACIRVLSAGEKKADPTNAARQARHRAKGRSNGVTVTRDPPNDIVLTPEELPQEAKASLPQGAKTKRDAVAWPCPANVEPGHWRDFMANRRRKRCAWTQTALDGVTNDLEKYSDDEWPPGRLVQRSAEKGWASICDPRSSLNGASNGQSRSEPSDVGPTERAIRAAIRSHEGGSANPGHPY